jgi:hypothetical protein
MTRRVPGGFPGAPPSEPTRPVPAEWGRFLSHGIRGVRAPRLGERAPLATGDVLADGPGCAANLGQ